MWLYSQVLGAEKSTHEIVWRFQWTVEPGRFLLSIPGVENGNPLQYPCLESSMDSGAWWAIVHEVAKSQIQLSM